MTFRFDHSTSFPKAEKIVDRSGGDDSRDLLSINQSKCQVVWYGALGCKVHCRFTFQSCPIDAKFCQFKANNSERKLGTHEDDSGSLVKRAIAILLDNGDLQIRLFSGEVHELTLPYQIKRLLSISNGLLLERRVSEEEGALKCLWMANPLSPLTVVESNER